MTAKSAESPDERALDAPADSPAQDSRRRGPTLIQAFTLAVWLTWLVIALLGWWLDRRVPDPAPPPPPPEAPVVQAELVDVQVTREPVQPVVQDSPPPPADLAAPAEAPPLPEVAPPGPAIAFALPVEGPVRIVNAARAAIARPTPAPARVERIVYGQGSGRQPAPDYPQAAIIGRQEGVVGVQFTAGSDGRVTEAHVVEPSRWPLLNQAAVEAVRDRWADPSWSGRTKIVSIRFQLNQS